MLIKRITCRVREYQKESFFESQKQWSRLHSVKGFIGQLGGWRYDPNLTACVFAFWETRKDYDLFMEKTHDEIFFDSAQGSTYSSIEVQLYEGFGSALNSAGEMSDLIRQSQYIRVTVGQGEEDKKENSDNTQEATWNSGRAGAQGLIGGTYAFSQQEVNQFLVLTGWKDEISYRKNLESDFSLTSAEEPLKDFVEIKTEGMHVENAWRVLKKSGL
ncbi:YdbC family protein [Rossellomorea aquimaris]|uniref:YdbC family protein n=1 Tax=Rossellomorea aquimaris TaxID=189382 RepID=UPI001CFD5D93|nr:YdbC family protein [Rossellomorea aquimaris]